MSYDDLETALSYAFSDRSLLVEALTHRSWIAERGAVGDGASRDQQRLEFLGDAFLNFVVAQYLFRRFPLEAEGVLTRLRARRVKGPFVHAVGGRLGLVGLLRLGVGARAQVHKNKQVLEDTMEALVGAVLEDGGADAGRDLVLRCFLADPPTLAELEDDDPVSRFHQVWQLHFRSSPPAFEYESFGTADDPTWVASIELPNYGEVEGDGSSKAEAKRRACVACLDGWVPTLPELP